MNIDINDVIMRKDKMEFFDFRPGLVGGHCIGVDPYYLVYKSKKLGYSPKVISWEDLLMIQWEYSLTKSD